jgi:hypothetical protein
LDVSLARQDRKDAKDFLRNQAGARISEKPFAGQDRNPANVESYRSLDSSSLVCEVHFGSAFSVALFKRLKFPPEIPCQSEVLA